MDYTQLILPAGTNETSECELRTICSYDSGLAALVKLNRICASGNAADCIRCIRAIAVG